MITHKIQTYTRLRYINITKWNYNVSKTNSTKPLHSNSYIYAFTGIQTLQVNEKQTRRTVAEKKVSSERARDTQYRMKT